MMGVLVRYACNKSTTNSELEIEPNLIIMRPVTKSGKQNTQINEITTLNAKNRLVKLYPNTIRRQLECKTALVNT